MNLNYRVINLDYNLIEFSPIKMDSRSINQVYQNNLIIQVYRIEILINVEFLPIKLHYRRVYLLITQVFLVINLDYRMIKVDLILMVH